MADEKFHIQRYRKADDGTFVKDGAAVSLEDDFGFARYKSLSGINSRGKIKSVYTESFAENDSVRIHFLPEVSHEATSLTLNVVCFGASPDAPSDLSITEQVLAAERSWNDLCDFLETGLLLYTDNIRNCKLLCYSQKEKIPSEDIVKGVPRITCAIELSNVFGRTFGLDDNTIEDWLKNGGKEAE